MDSVSTNVKAAPAHSDHVDTHKGSEVRLKSGDLVNSLQFIVKVTRKPE